MTSPYPPEFLKGIDHFNRGEYFEAHEAWEAIWLETGGARSDFYKGLIQCAVAIYHFDRGNLSGARRLYENQRAYLVKFVPRTMGVAVDELIATTDALFAPLLAAGPGAPVTMDRSRVPKIALGAA